MRPRSFRMLTAGSILMLGLASCSDDATSPSPQAGGTSSSTPTGSPDTGSPAASTSTLVVSDSALGPVLTDGEGWTVYLFKVDKNGESACYDGCETTWPPLEANGAPTAGEGIDDSLLGTTERTDGTTQVTYAGHPLYRYAEDKAPGDTNGQKVGDVWFVVAASGDPVEARGGASSSHSDDSGGMYG